MESGGEMLKGDQIAAAALPVNGVWRQGLAAGPATTSS